MPAISNIQQMGTKRKTVNANSSANYKFVDLPNLNNISNIIMQYMPEEVKKHTLFKSLPEKQFSLCKPLVEAVETIKPWSDIFYIALITVAPRAKLNIHVDWDDMKDSPFALNIPIYNCAKTPSIFYRLKDNAETKVVYQDHGDPYHYYDESQAEEIERFYLTKAAFFNTQTAHSSINDTDEPRIVISVRFKTPLKF
jgi:hypothetical protein